MGRNIVGQIVNNYIELINSQLILPKAVLIILEGDLLDSLHHYQSGATDGIQPLVDWLVTELFRVTTGYKEKLVSKSRKFRYLQIIFVGAVHHNGFGGGKAYREKFNRCLQEATNTLRGCLILMLASWNAHDCSLVSHGSLTGKGMECYWEAMNDAFQQWDKNQMRLQTSSTASRGLRHHEPRWQNRRSRYNFTSHQGSDRNFERYHWRKH